MDHSSGQHHETQAQPLENMLAISCPKVQQENRKPMRPQPEQALRCPRCDSTNTKFCYYNNYSLSQPRYFCKSCRRYWTKGGTLRNVPVGGGCRRNKRPSPSTSSSSSPSSKRSHDQPLSANSSRLMLTDTHLSSLPFEPTDLTLAFAKLQNQSNGPMGLFDAHNNFQNVYCGFGSGSSGGVENGGFPNFEHYNSSSSIASTATATAMKQELVCNGDQNTVLWGFPWQFNYGDGNNMGDLDSGRESWNFNGNGIASSWHGLLNSPLM